MSHERAEAQYLRWAETILDEGEPDEDRTGVGTLEYFGEPQMRVDLREEFPLLTSKHVADRLIRTELAWMLHGDTNLRYLAVGMISIFAVIGVIVLITVILNKIFTKKD